MFPSIRRMLTKSTLALSVIAATTLAFVVGPALIQSASAVAQPKQRKYSVAMILSLQIEKAVLAIPKMHQAATEMTRLRLLALQETKDKLKTVLQDQQ